MSIASSVTPRSALIGYSGFVGSALDGVADFDARYRASNIESIRGRSFDLVVSAGLPAAKWLANQDPEADWASVERLMNALREVRTRELVMISTVDVYGRPGGVDEADSPEPGEATPYGAHRLRFEEFARGRFKKVTVVRLPALFGPGLKKNVLFDLLHARELAVINPRSAFQWYDVRDLWRDIGRIRATGLELMNLATAPVDTLRLLECFPELDVGERPAPRIRYDMRTRHAEVLGGEGPYIQSEDQVLERIARFVSEVRAGRVTCATPSRT